MRTDKQIINQTNELARIFYKLQGYNVKKSFKFYESNFPQEKLC